MSLRKRLLWVHRTYSPEVFLRTLGLVEGQHRGGLRGHDGLTALTWDSLVPPHSIGLNNMISGSEPDECPSLKDQADWLAAWIRSGRSSEPQPLHDVYSRSLWYTPDDSRMAPLVPWVAKVVKDAIKERDRDSFFRTTLQRWPTRPRRQPERFLADHVRAFTEAGHAAGKYHLTVSDTQLATTIYKLGSNLGTIVDYKLAHPGVDLGRMDLDAAVRAADLWHADLLARRQAQGARGYPGATIYTWDDGWTAQVLVSREQLEAEGEAMGHCVGGYYTPRYGGSAIASLRDPKGDPHVTVELELLEHTEGYHPGAPVDADPPVAISPHLLERPSGTMGIHRIPEDYSPPKAAIVVQTNEYGDKMYLLMAKVSQAKGKGNQRPKDTYLPYLRDLLEWLEVDVEDWGEARAALQPRDVYKHLTTPFDNAVRYAWRTSEVPEDVVFTPEAIFAQKEKLKDLGAGHVDEIRRLWGMLTLNRMGSGQQWSNPLDELAEVIGPLGMNDPERFTEVMAPLADQMQRDLFDWYSAPILHPQTNW